MSLNEYYLIGTIFVIVVLLFLFGDTEYLMRKENELPKEKQQNIMNLAINILTN